MISPIMALPVRNRYHRPVNFPVLLGACFVVKMERASSLITVLWQACIKVNLRACQRFKCLVCSLWNFHHHNTSLSDSEQACEKFDELNRMLNKLSKTLTNLPTIKSTLARSLTSTLHMNSSTIITIWNDEIFNMSLRLLSSWRCILLDRKPNISWLMTEHIH